MLALPASTWGFSRRSSTKHRSQNPWQADSQTTKKQSNLFLSRIAEPHSTAAPCHFNRHTILRAALFRNTCQTSRPITSHFILTKGRTDGSVDVSIKRGHFPDWDLFGTFIIRVEWSSATRQRTGCSVVCV